MGIGKEIVATGTEFFVAVGVFPVELSAYQIQRSSALQIGQDKVLYLYTWYKIGSSVWHHQSSDLHVLRIFQTYISSELSADICKTVNGIFSLSWNSMWYILKKNQEVKISS